MKTIAPLVGEIVTAMRQRPELGYEIVFVDDGSTDGTWEQIEAAAAADPRVRALRFRHQLRQGRGAGGRPRRRRRGEIVITMDADMQDDPSELPRLLASWRRRTTW